MLNISPNSIKNKVEKGKFSSFSLIDNEDNGKNILKFLKIILFLLVVILFVPWTQNIRTKGYVTTLNPAERPQTIHSVIPGRIEKWFVREGDFVKKGDTIIYISEVKDQYFDPNLLNRTQEQIKSKEMSVDSYIEKVKALDNQIDALIQTQALKKEQARNKLEQAKLKLESDSMDLEASKINYNISQEQFKRMEKLYADGLKSLTELESRKLKLQEAKAKQISLENKVLSSKNDIINAIVELSTIDNEYRDKMSKSEADKYSALSNMYDAETEVTKLQNSYTNYSVRTGYYFITSPQDGYITKAIQSGIGETIKEGAEIVSIMPSSYNLAVEMYVRPFDLPLIRKEQKVRIQFDGWPAIVFSGWPTASYGTFGGKVFAIDNFISDNGMFRVMVAPDKNDHEWPKAIKVGSGAIAMALINDVPIWYELWRKLNGFPPDYYSEKEKTSNKK